MVRPKKDIRNKTLWTKPATHAVSVLAVDNMSEYEWGTSRKVYLGSLILIVQCVHLAKSVTHIPIVISQHDRQN